MVKKLHGWKVKGMNRDNSVSAFTGEFAFENKNLRLITNDNNTLLSWVNERGPAAVTLAINEAPWDEDDEWESSVTPGSYIGTTITGAVIGTAILNKQLVLFTHDINTLTPDRIYVFWWNDINKSVLLGKIFYVGNLNFSTDYPLETSVSFESNHIRKVYWTDGRNQPRLINIADDNNKLASRHTDYGNTLMPQEHWFDFVPSVELNETFNVAKTAVAGGTFAPGVIQYCFTYVNKHGQQTNIINVSPLFYLAHADRGGSPEDRVSAVFQIDVLNPDPHFDYVRLYSIQRTTLDSDPIVRLLDDIEITENTTDVDIDYEAHYTDNGTTGEAMDPMELLYVGGKEITALTMTDKDNTLFLGNLTQKNVSLKGIQDYFNDNRNSYEITYNNSDVDSPKHLTIDTYSCEYIPQFNNNSYEITTFKGGETYRFGFQLQKYTGEWSEPVFIRDEKNELYPRCKHVLADAYLTYASLELDISDFADSVEDFYGVYKRIRPVIVFPNMNDRGVLCQGVLNPTVFNVEDRKEKLPFAQASWYFRPYTWSGSLFNTNGAVFKHLDPLFTQYEAYTWDWNTSHSERWTYSLTIANTKKIEIQGSVNSYSGAYSTTIQNVHSWDNLETEHNEVKVASNTQFLVDQSIVTLNSPDIEFDTDIQLTSMDNVKLRVIGIVPITKTASSHSIDTQSALLEYAHNLKHYLPLSGRIGTGEVSESYTAPLLSNYIWEDAAIAIPVGDEELLKEDDVITWLYGVNHLIFPWHRSGALNNDYRTTAKASAVLDTKKESNYHSSPCSDYFSFDTTLSFANISSKILLTENAEIFNTRLPKQGTSSSDINYYSNVDKILYNNNGYKDIMLSLETGNVPEFYPNDYDKEQKMYWATLSTPVSMKYKSTSHAIIALNDALGSGASIPILPYGRSDGTNTGSGAHSMSATFWGDAVGYTQDYIDISDFGKPDFLWLGELYRDDADIQNRFGNTNKWMIAGPVKLLPSEDDEIQTVTLNWLEGDTYYQRYDCLKTYAFTKQDPNQIVEILSFMCETHINLDGRYDKLRGQTRAYNVSPEIFNLLNPVYSQKDNFFLSQQITVDEQETFHYPNMITYTKTKESGADVDMWTNMTLASILEMDGDKGVLSSLNRFNDQIIAFQDKAISQILYNENVQIASREGVPIEIANSQKVQGKRYLSDKVGCSNKWSIVDTPSGIYFMDSNNKNIYVFNGQVQDVSNLKGFNTWSKLNIPSAEYKWNPVAYNSTSAPTGFNNFVSYYDKLNQDVLFINKDTCLAYSDKFAVFTSFYDYGNMSYFDNFEDVGLWSIVNIEPIPGEDNKYRYKTAIRKHQAGNYLPYSMTLVGSPEPTLDKTFTNLEFRACVDGDGAYSTVGTDTVFTPYLPFDTLETWNEHQHGTTILQAKNGYSGMTHLPNLPSPTDSTPIDYSSALKRKFRIWRCDIPRDNAPTASDVNLNISRPAPRPLNRMRNPWLYLKLTKSATSTVPRAEIHDILMSYFV